MKARTRGQRGFTIAEILIALSVITIALLGTVAAIAFGLRASRLGADNTVAIQVNRKVMELILQGIYPASSETQFHHGEGNPNDARGAAPWRPVYLPPAAVPRWFVIQDYGFAVGSNEANLFTRDTQNFELDVSAQAVPPADYGSNSYSPSNKFRKIVVQTRWQDRNATTWKVVRTEAYSLPEGP